MLQIKNFYWILLVFQLFNITVSSLEICFEEKRPTITYTLTNPTNEKVKFWIKNSLFESPIPLTELLHLELQQNQIEKIWNTKITRKSPHPQFILLEPYSNLSMDIDLFTLFEVSSVNENYRFILKQKSNQEYFQLHANLYQGPKSLYLNSEIELRHKSLSKNQNLPIYIQHTDPKLQIYPDAFINPTINLDLNIFISKIYEYCPLRWNFVRDCIFQNQCKQYNFDSNTRQGDNEKEKEEEKEKEGSRILEEKIIEFSEDLNTTLIVSSKTTPFEHDQYVRATQLLVNRLTNIQIYLNNPKSAEFTIAKYFFFRNWTRIESIIEPFKTVLQSIKGKRIVFYDVEEDIHHSTALAWSKPNSAINNSVIEIYFPKNTRLERLTRGILSLSSLIFHEFMHSTVGMIDQCDDDSCYTFDGVTNFSIYNPDLAIQNVPNFEFFLDFLPISLKIYNSHGFPCGLAEEGEKQLICSHSQVKSDVHWKCDLSTDNRARYWCSQLCWGSYKIPLGKTLQLSAKKQQFEIVHNNYYGGWLIRSMELNDVWENDYDGQVTLGQQQTNPPLKSLFEIHFEGVSGMRTINLSPRLKNTQLYSYFDDVGGMQGELTENTKLRTWLTFFGFWNYAYLRITPPNNPEPQWVSTVFLRGGRITTGTSPTPTAFNFNSWGVSTAPGISTSNILFADHPTRLIEPDFLNKKIDIMLLLEGINKISDMWTILEESNEYPYIYYEDEEEISNR